MIIDVIGIGAEGLSSLSPAARSALSTAEVVLGSPRQLALVDAPTTRPWPSPLVPALPGIIAELSGKRVAVLASGDPLFHGIASTLRREVPEAQLRIYPAVSSFALACARLGWAHQETDHTSLVTGEVDAIGVLVDQARPFLVLGRNRSSAAQVCDYLDARGLGEATVTVLADLGSDAECITTGTAAQPPALNSDLAVIAVEPPARAGRSLAPGLSDHHYENDGQLTKQDIRALTVCALAPVPGELLWDIGGGSGSISIEWLRLDPRNRARVFESHPERVQRIAANARALGVPQLKISGAAPEALLRSDSPDCIFIGGGLTHEGVWEAAWEALRPGGRLVANAVTAESVEKLWQLKQRYGGCLRRIAIENETTIGSFTAYKPAYPVWQWRIHK
ncbi:Precorrin-6Y C(5,15)-methyltransferase [decarboxylating] [Corynebacterium ciconiae DSM 44920]|uniref:precorrin-6y C5,15-methyltransferase (decarboxylating) subunit CbiE n=1 Tax=Corynebacterium ciconiae TaxID=227319 RepID=UPI000364F730|nr:precorrin-6y C5,15-methyltransferase (decarboxylating) subunit CbiE [Corynebacterium ciconiae]WKD61174.1 Precorrin-6Y C(5,15)-methyltransferase [decarboxylating] [Corynebacterium ciconiae DSM 44920]